GVVGDGDVETGTAGVGGLIASAPPGVTHPGFAERNPSEIPSRTQSVSAFLLDKASVGAPLLRQRSLRALQHRHPLKIAPCSNTEGEGRRKRPRFKWPFSLAVVGWSFGVS